MRLIRGLTGIWIIALLAILASCGGDDPVDPVDSTEYDTVISTGGQFETVVTQHDTVAEPTVTDVVGNETFFCTTTHYDIVDAPPDFVLFNPNAGVIWPGNLVQGSTLNTNSPSNIYARRGPGTVTISILNGSPDVTRSIDEVSYGNIQQAMNNIISTAVDTLPARFQLDYEEVQTFEQLAVSLDVSVSYAMANVGTHLAFSHEHQYNRFVVKLNQAFFDMVFDPPSRLDGFFHSDVTPADLDPYMGPGNPPAFIRQVTYGRIYYLLVESTSSRTEMSASISASFNAAAVGIDMENENQFVNSLENVKVKCFALGGDQQMALAAFNGDFSAVRTFLTNGAAIRTGMPLSYVACALAPPHNVVNMAVAANYDVTHCIPVGESFENPRFWYQASGDGVAGEPDPIELSSGHVTAWNNRLFYDDDNMDATPKDGYTSAGTYSATGANGKASVSFASPSGSVGGSLGYPGLGFQDSSYTVVAVVRLKNRVTSFPAYFMFGDSDTDGRNLKLGFRDDARVTMTTGDSQVLNATVGNPVTNFNVLTFVFSRRDGMSIYVNLDTTPAASNPALTDPLASYTGARIGSNNGAEIEIAEIKSYGIAFHDAQREFVVEKLMLKYGI